MASFCIDTGDFVDETVAADSSKVGNLEAASKLVLEVNHRDSLGVIFEGDVSTKFDFPIDSFVDILECDNVD